MESRLWEAELTQLELQQKLELARYRLELAKPIQQVFDECKEWEARLDSGAAQLAKLRLQRQTLQHQVAEGNERLTNLQRDAIQARRALMAGRNQEFLALDDGRTFEQASVVSIDDAGVSIRHRHGSIRLGIDSLSEREREVYGIERGSAIAAVERERQQAAAYGKWIDLELARLAELDRASKAALASHANTAIRSAALGNNRTATPRISPLAQAARPVGSGTSYWRRYHRAPRDWYYPSYRQVVVCHRPAVMVPMSCSSSTRFASVSRPTWTFTTSPTRPSLPSTCPSVP